MNEAEQTQQQDPIDVRQLAGAIRFALVGIILGLSLLGLRTGPNIESFRKIFEDMLGKEEALPAVTRFVLNAGPWFVVVSYLTPILAVWTLFLRSFVVSFYIIGVLGFITVGQFIIIFHGFFAPLVKIAENMNK